MLWEERWIKKEELENAIGVEEDSLVNWRGELHLVYSVKPQLVLAELKDLEDHEAPFAKPKLPQVTITVEEFFNDWPSKVIIHGY